MKRECSNCVHVSTPKGHQCYTLTKAIKNIHPFIPSTVIPVMDELAKNCRRYKLKR